MPRKCKTVNRALSGRNMPKIRPKRPKMRQKRPKKALNRAKITYFRGFLRIICEWPKYDKVVAKRRFKFHLFICVFRALFTPSNDLKATSIIFEYILIEIYVANMYFTSQILKSDILRFC